jgi:hypothetical protein
MITGRRGRGIVLAVLAAALLGGGSLTGVEGQPEIPEDPAAAEALSVIAKLQQATAPGTFKASGG